MVVFGEEETDDENNASSLMGISPNKGKGKMMTSSSPKRVEKVRIL